MNNKPDKKPAEPKQTPYELAHLALVLEMNDRQTGQPPRGQDFYFRRARDLYTAAQQYLANNT